jgi:EmrB/QacA subfamily drug resistance transporter
MLSPAAPPSPREARTAIAVAALATAMLMLDISVVNAAMSDIASSLRTDLSGLQWIVDAYTLPLAATVLTAGAIADRIGRRRVFLIGLGVFTAASAAAGLSGGTAELVAARAVQGIGGSILFATALALIAQVSPTPVERAKALAVYGATIGASFAVGPFVGGALTSALGWRAIFLVNVPIGVATLIVTLRRVRESRDLDPRKVDWAGQATLMLGLFLLVFGLLRGNEDGWGSAPVATALAGAALSLAAFVVVELKSRAPMLPLSLFRDRTFAGSQIAVFAIAASFFAMFMYTTLYLQSVVGLSAIETGLAYLPTTGVMFVVSGATAQLGERIAPGVLVTIGLALVSAGMVALLLLEAGSSWTVTLPGLLLAAVGTGLFNPAGSAVALSALPEHQSGLAAGANDTFRQGGVALGIAALGALVPAGSALGGSVDAYVDGLHTAALVAAAVAAAGAIASARLLTRAPAGARLPRLAEEPAT